MGSYSVVQGIRCLMGQPLHCSAANGGVRRERLWWWLQPLRVTQPYPLLPWLPGFPSQACLTTISSLLSPQSIHLSVVNSNPYTGCSTVPRLHLPAAEPSRGPASLSGVCMAAARTIWFSFYLGHHRSAFSLSALNVSPLTQAIALMWRSDPCFSSPSRRGQVQSY